MPVYTWLEIGVLLLELGVGLGKSGSSGISHGKGEGHVVYEIVFVVGVAPPTHVGAWSMAVLLEQPFEYFTLQEQSMHIEYGAFVY